MLNSIIIGKINHQSSVVVVSQIATADKSRLLEKIGTVDRENIVQIVNNCQQVIKLST